MTAECWDNLGASTPIRGTSRSGRAYGRALTWAHVLLLLHVGHVEAPQVHRSHAECELANCAPLSQPIREPGQVAVTVQVVGVEAPGRGRAEGRHCHSMNRGGCHWLNSGPNLFAPLCSVTALGGHCRRSLLPGVATDDSTARSPHPGQLTISSSRSHSSFPPKKASAHRRGGGQYCSDSPDSSRTPRGALCRCHSLSC